ncbi:MAG: hypothetical protein IJ533_05865 [Prevotella sp.]|nr:hypothetical protein [Prevotella sp.]
MDKKRYVAPAVDVLAYDGDEELLGTVSSDWGIGYGTVDEDGTMDPSLRADNDFWD